MSIKLGSHVAFYNHLNEQIIYGEVVDLYTVRGDEAWASVIEAGSNLRHEALFSKLVESKEGAIKTRTNVEDTTAEERREFLPYYGLNPKALHQLFGNDEQLKDIFVEGLKKMSEDYFRGQDADNLKIDQETYDV